ncbi:MAG TPA: TlpA disulfide reductase family protein [Kiritimatiellia bacterium]|nr:TlpA disulfide reductase family protein [Kiritimatiellia bacterium]
MTHFKSSLLIPVSCLLLLAACGRKPAAPPVDLGPAPAISDFVLKNLASEFPGEIKTAEYAGKVQLVIFFRTDDPACRGSIPGWNGLQKEFHDRGFVLVGVVVDDRPVAKLAAEAAALGAEFPVGLATDARLVEAFGGSAAIRAIPTAFLLNRDGALARTYPGYEPLPALRDDVVRVLDGQPLPSKTAKSP